MRLLLPMALLTVTASAAAPAAANVHNVRVNLETGEQKRINQDDHHHDSPPFNVDYGDSNEDEQIDFYAAGGGDSDEHDLDEYIYDSTEDEFDPDYLTDTT